MRSHPVRILLLVGIVFAAVIAVVALSAIPADNAPVDANAAAFPGFKLTNLTSHTAPLKVGDKITLSASAVTKAAAPNQKLTNAKLILKFDPQVVDATDVQPALGLVVNNKAVDKTAGIVTLDVKRSTDFANGQTIATVIFTLKNADKDITISVDSHSVLGNPNIAVGNFDRMGITITPSISCPRLMPPAPSFCQNGHLVSHKDANGCNLAPTCETGTGSQGDGGIACTMEARQCPDGSYVGRDSNNNCEFKPCPTTTK